MTLSIAVSGGVFFQVLAERLRIPAIAPLLVGGVLLGPEFAGLVQPDSLGATMQLIISFAVAIILFEGGLTLNIKGYLNADKIIHRLLSVGVLITWFGTALIIKLLFGFSLMTCALAGSLIIVTGPTVITPLLKRVRVNDRLNQTLLWEGVMIDPIGVFVAVLCFEWLSSEAAVEPLENFLVRILVGGVVGGLSGLLLADVHRRKWVPEEHTNLFVLAAVLLCFGICETVKHEAGILAAVVAGQVFALRRPTGIESIKKFKTELTHLGIGVLFILLSAALKLDAVAAFGWQGALAVLGVLFIVRPLNIFASTIGSGLSTRDKLFLSWIAPRGVVAASMAALFALKIEHQGSVAEGTFIRTFVYAVIAATVLVQGLSAGLVARFLGVLRDTPSNCLFIGAHPLSIGLAQIIEEECGVKCMLVDTNPNTIADAMNKGLTTVRGDALAQELMDSEFMDDVGRVFALTDNTELNMLACHRWSERLHHPTFFHWTDSPADPVSADHRTGLPVWSVLPCPSKIASEIEMGDSRLLVISAQEIGEHPDLLPLAYVKGKSFVPIAAGEKPPPKTKVLLLERGRTRLGQLLKPEHVMLSEETSLEGLLRKMISRVAEDTPIVPVEETLVQLLEREQYAPTGIGRGVAIPHGYCNDLKSPICVIAQVPHGIEWQSSDGEPTRLVFMLLSSPRRPEEHLALVAQIARLAIKEETIMQLIAVERPDELIEMILDTEYRHLRIGEWFREPRA
ncbi:MAG: cation:proton antiporter [Planctomycetota bacterium]|nr:cation:proton antiporter [Planctomycetota bacterium]MDP7132171.1 cation:proton antiporter [Planctomycetota bacterium]